jgi:hypothetical protein
MSLRRRVMTKKRGERHTLVSPTLEQLMIISRSEMCALPLTAHLSYLFIVGTKTLLQIQIHCCTVTPQRT